MPYFKINLLCEAKTLLFIYLNVNILDSIKKVNYLDQEQLKKIFNGLNLVSIF